MKWLLPVAVRAPTSLLVSLMLVRLTDEWFTFFPAGSIAPIRDDLGLSYAQAGIVLTALASGGLLGHGFGIAADYVDRRMLAAFGAALEAVCLAAFALADSFLVLVIAASLWGAATDAFVHGCEVALVDLYRDQLAPVLARVNALSSVGDLLGPLTLAGVAAVGLSWRVAFAGAAVVMALYAIVIWFQQFPPASPPEDEPSPVRGTLAVLRDPRVVLLAVVLGLFSALDEPFWGFTIIFLEEERSVTGAVATAIVAVGVAGGLAGFLSVGTIIARWRERTVVVAAGAGVAVAVTGMIVLPSALLVAACAFAFGVSGAIFYSLLQAVTLALRPGQAGTTGAIVSAIGLFALGVPPLAGAIADRAGISAALALYVAVAVAMAVLVVFVRGSEPPPTPGPSLAGAGEGSLRQR